ncbi:MAG: 30S ribosome-binding factor RbfA [Deltaproteobacteria bacterium]|nr:30S ribosome-binding factor RbfA [Deltaproteobacteria bacterium]
MLAGKRATRVGDQILKEIADLLIRKIKDPRIKGVTLTGIDLSDDLRHAKVYYSLMGDKTGMERIQAGLDSAKGFIKREIGLRLHLRYIPEILFRYDSTLEMGDQMEKLFQKIKRDAVDEEP